MSGSASGTMSTALQEGWTLHTVDEIDSTNSAAAQLPAWHALRAVTQIAGRGRTGRYWVSDEGGLWLSAVLPCPGSRQKWAILPLAVGWAIMGALREFGVDDIRLRWPNDLLVGRRKLAGILIERFNDETAVVGLGINIENQPELAAGSTLLGETVRLRDLVLGGYSIDDVARLLLGALRRMHAVVLDHGFHGIATELNLAWANPRRVAVTLERGGSFHGAFEGIDNAGRLRVGTDREGPRYYHATEVALLRELE